MFAEEIAAADSSSDEGVDSSEEEEEAVESKPVAKSAPKPEEESEEEVDETELLQGIDSSEGEDSSDDEGDLESTFAKDEFTDNKPHIALDPQDEAKLKKKLEQLDQKAHTEKVDTGVIYLGRIPHGFYEDEMRAYFGQFGTVTRLRLSRNKKTGKSKHYAFIEFKSMDVAEIVAETMNNYLLYGHLLKCKVIPEDKLHPKLFDGANKKFKVIPWNKIAREEHNKPKTRESRNRVVKKLLKKEAKTRAKLQELGIDYDFPGYTGDVKPKSKRIVFDN
ncbi:RNA-binding domain-containing protein [Basidiobolus meristosporus CBS 931.73]|uniref:RNA-binding domain-containing protein n=1 Tax=Basidiobolus meristosporus CBS 931.73 TaxID=1314790 RepID=A0A1Y1X8K7_9FUNG|nr:RNA-binding domain-containing protein [Basidiobolus meristosporus CBS 931.73]|eukprot:ORX82090.1 RNA-binding domain-containing protein [Basidiobolus meristosporus CBS 931.73]